MNSHVTIIVDINNKGIQDPLFIEFVQRCFVQRSIGQWTIGQVILVLAVWSAKDKSKTFLSKGVYQIPYSCGKTYIEQTCRSIQTRLKENIVDTNHNRVNKFAIVEHSFKSKHHIFFDQTKILSCIVHYCSRLLREDDDYKLSHYINLGGQLTHH